MVAIVPIRMENNEKEGTSSLIPISIETAQLPKPLVPSISQQRFCGVRRWGPGPCLLSFCDTLKGEPKEQKDLCHIFKDPTASN